MTRFLLTCAATIGAVCIFAQTTTSLHLPPIFSNHIVLQQNTKATIWGYGNASSTVCAVGSWNPSDTVNATVNDGGHWSLRIPTTSHGGPHTLSIFYKGFRADTIRLQDVMVGEVWLCSGQSNMEWTPANGIENAATEIAAARNNNIRFFSLAKTAADSPQHDCIGKWESCTPEVMRRRSALAYFFGHNISERVDSDSEAIPVGLIVSAWGGTPAEVWTPADSIAADPFLSATVKTAPTPWWPVKPGVLFNSMIYPLMPYSIAGAIWYQGESNRENPQPYRRLMSTLINSWRKGFSQDFPFFIVQIAPYNYNSSNNGPALIRQAQQQVADSMDSVWLAPTVDIGNPSNIHPAKKAQVGKRLANLALRHVYGLPIEGSDAPRAIAITSHKNTLQITFENTGSGITAKQDKIPGLQIAGTDGIFHPAVSKLKNNILTVSAPEVKIPVAVRYCFDDASEGTLFNSYGLPVLPFSLSINK